MKYAGFRSRLNAYLGDMIVYMPVMFLWFWLMKRSTSFTMHFVTAQLMSIIFLFYQIYFHTRWGQTLGKKYAKVQVVKLDGTPISWKEAFLRNSVDIVLAVISTIGLIMALILIINAGYQDLDWLQRSKVLNEFNPLPKWVSYFSIIWSLSEFITLLFNKKKRALHDFIAGTVVIHKEKLLATDQIPSDRPPLLG